MDRLEIHFGGSTRMEQTTKTITMKRPERTIRIHGASNTGEPARERRPRNIMETRGASETGAAARESQPLGKLNRHRKPAWKDEPARESLVAERASVLKILFGGSTQMEQTTKTITMKRLERVIRIHGASNAGEPARERRPPRIVEMRGASDAGALPRES